MDARRIVSGSVAELHRWPVKSMAGEPVSELRVDRRGAGGDRTHALVHPHKGELRRLTAREAPRMLAWRATYDGAEVDPAAPPEPALVAPDGAQRGWSDPELPHALAADLGRDVLLHRDVAGQQDLGDSLLITTAATLAALEAELELLHPCARCAIPTRHPDNQVKWAELLRHLVRAHGGLFGINARPLAPATIRVGDPVALV